MKKTNLVFVALAAMLLAGCSKPSSQVSTSDTTPTDTTPVHEHNPSAEWSKDATDHWHTCDGCDELLDKAAHTFVDEVTAPTYEAGGYTTHTCSVCGYYYVDSETAKLEPTQLVAPVLSYNAESGKIEWAAVENAAGYKVLDGETVIAESTEERSLALDATIGAHSITVVAVNSAIEYKDSDASAAYAYESKAVALEGVSADAGAITITGAAGYVTVYDGAGNALAPLGINATSYTAESSDLYTFGASATYDSENRVNYVGEAVYKNVRVVFDATAALVLEDGSAESDADLADKYTAAKFSNNAWASSSASVKLADGDPDVSEGKCVKLNFWNHGAWFKFNSPVAVKDGYEGVTFTIKAASSDSSFSFTLNDKDGNYASYKITGVPTTWTTYNVRFDAAGWNVNGSGYTIAQAAAAKGTTVKNFVAGVTSYDLRVYHASDANGNSNSILLDDLKILPVLAESSVETHIKSYAEYICENGDALIDIKLNGAKATMAATGFAAAAMEFNVALNGTEVSLSNDNVTYVGTLSTDGKTLTYKTATGAYASVVENLSFVAGKLLDNFESYTETGTGYDQKNSDLTKVSGLRANYFSDYYSGGSGSPVGGSGWSLMGSTDYVQLETTNGRGSGKAMKHKVNNNTMRVMTGGLATGTAENCGTASTLKFSIKGNTSGYTINARTFYTSKITSSNQQSTDVTKGEALTVAAGTEWVNYSLTLMAKDFYGFGFTFKSGPSSAIYVLIDNMYLVY